ncbi:MAG TPA: hypothetical protein VIL85_22360 [Thermomicrobiales bacterium]|jgi:hypothetical protein
MTGSGQNDDVTRALAILRDAGFPVERIRVLPVAEGPAEVLPTIDRAALLDACCELLEDDVPRSAKEFALDLRKTFPGLTRKGVSSVLSREGQGRVVYDRDDYTYMLTEID